ncbi:MAG: YCF48-related protein [Pseudomonadota bacterium]
MRRNILYLYVMFVGACSSSNGTQAQDSNPIWPDAFLEAGVDASLDLGGEQSSIDLADDQVIQDIGPINGWVASTVGTVDLHAVACVQGDVFAVGNGGTVLHHKSTDPPGKVFSTVDTPTIADLYTVTFADLTYGVVAGNDPKIWESKDGGTTWTVAPQCSNFSFETFYSLYLFSPTEGFGAGLAANLAGAGFKYFSGGSWVCGGDPYPDEIFYGVFRLGDKGWLVGDTKGKIYYSGDKGATWDPTTYGTNEVLKSVHFAELGLGVAVGEKGSIFSSQDEKGSIWTQVTSPVSTDLWDIHFWNAKLGWAVGEAGTILYTSDGGQTWTQQTSNTTSRLEGICFTSATEGWAVGEGGTVLYTNTSGS